jgi:DNA polymerase-3 subunit alpha
VDLDVEHVRRKDFIEYLHGRFVVHHIGTWLEYFLASEGEEDEDTKGSLLRKYYSAQKRAGREFGGWKDVPRDDQLALKELSRVKEGPHKRPGAYYAYGTHPAGIVLTTTTDEFDSIVPMMKIASSGTFVSQYDGDDIEAFGLVKLDALGLKTLTVLHRTMDFLGRDVFEGLDWIPLNDRETFKMIAKGDTAGIFQLEGGTSRRGCKDLKPTNVNDVVAAMALFRPATMGSGATEAYIKRKHHQMDTPKRHPVIEKHVKRTHGIMLFQEQVMAILRDLGMNADDLTAFLKAVKASNENIGDAGAVIAGFQEQIRVLCFEKAGMDGDDWRWLWDAIEGFAKYGFNQAHSTSYGLTAYYCAYLAVNHPIEFHAALLSVAAGNKDKEPGYVRAARTRGLRILSPNINSSGFSYEPEGTVIRKGLLSIKGIGEKTAQELIDKRPPGGYESLEQLCSLVDRRKITGARPFIEKGDISVGVIGKLVDMDILGDLPKGRS